MRTIGRTSSCGQELTTATAQHQKMATSETKYAITCSSSETTFLFGLMCNRRTALWALFYEIHIMLIVTLDVISELELSLRECTEFTERYIRCLGSSTERSLIFLLLFGVLYFKFLPEWMPTAKTINQ